MEEPIKSAVKDPMLQDRLNAVEHLANIIGQAGPIFAVVVDGEITTKKDGDGKIIQFKSLKLSVHAADKLASVISELLSDKNSMPVQARRNNKERSATDGA